MHEVETPEKTYRSARPEAILWRHHGAKRAAQQAKRAEAERKLRSQPRVATLLAKTEHRRALIYAQGFREGQVAKQAEYVSRGFPSI